MKFRLSLPTNEAFFQRYAGLVPTLSKLGYLAQVVSALTEVGILFALIRGAVADITTPGIATAAGIAGAILGTAFIEIGLRKFLPFSVRQILNKRFAGLDLVMSIAIFTASVLLLSASGFLSFFGSKDTVEVVTPQAKKGEVVTGLYDDLKSGETAMFTADSATITARYAAQLSALDAAHTSSLQAAKTKLAGIESKERNTGQSYSSQKAGIRQTMADAQAAHGAQVAALIGAQANELKDRQAKRDAALLKVDTRLDNAFATEEKQFAVATAKREKQVKAWGGSIAWFTVLCLCVLLLAITLQEVHRHGAGMQEEAMPNEYHFRESPISAFFAAITERIHYTIFAQIKSIEDGTPEPPQPGKAPVVYEYEQKAERRAIGFKPIPLHRRPEDTHVGDDSSAKEELKDMRYNATVITQGETIPEKLALKHCEHCGTLYPPKVVWQRFCQTACKEAHHTAKHGGRKYDPSLSRKRK
jgi:hypothetical protein